MRPSVGIIDVRIHMHQSQASKTCDNSYSLIAGKERDQGYKLSLETAVACFRASCWTHMPRSDEEGALVQGLKGVEGFNFMFKYVHPHCGDMTIVSNAIGCCMTP